MGSGASVPQGPQCKPPDYMRMQDGELQYRGSATVEGFTAEEISGTYPEQIRGRTVNVYGLRDREYYEDHLYPGETSQATFGRQLARARADIQVARYALAYTGRAQAAVRAMGRAVLDRALHDEAKFQSLYRHNCLQDEGVLRQVGRPSKLKFVMKKALGVRKFGNPGFPNEPKKRLYHT